MEAVHDLGDRAAALTGLDEREDEGRPYLGRERLRADVQALEVGRLSDGPAADVGDETTVGQPSEERRRPAEAIAGERADVPVGIGWRPRAGAADGRDDDVVPVALEQRRARQLDELHKAAS